MTLSHCDPLAVALAHEAGHVVGIDIEKRDPTKVPVFKRSLTEAEIVLCQTHQGDFETIANVIWTVKESLSKAINVIHGAF